MLEGEDDVEDSQELQDLCHFFDFIEGEVATGRSFEFTQVGAWQQPTPQPSNIRRQICYSSQHHDC